ncbi:MAG: beta-glucosidase [Clostridiales bacterium]|nr:beta-glucosidase [Clostridiales bacterium]
MTLEEKCSLLSGGTQFTSKAVPRLGIPARFFSDGPLGVRRQEGAADHLGLNPSVPATCYPAPSAIANAWDPALAEEVGTHLGVEAAALGVDVLLAPGLNIQRSPLCGRNFEYFSEDPYLSGKLAAAYIRGIQSQGVAACPKHFAVNSQETLRMHSDSVVDGRTLREIYLTGFEIAVKEGKPKCLMSSYNRVNGVYASENGALLQDILRDEWGFDGFVVTDWGGSSDRAAGLAAGNHLEMPATGGASDREVAAAVRAGRISEELVDRRIGELLSVLMELSPSKGVSAGFDREAHHAFARRAAGESIVLLKNEDRILPLAPGTRVAVIGDFAQTPRFQGGGSSSVNPTWVDMPLDCLRESGLDVVGYAPGFRRHGGEDAALRQQAAELADRADVVLVYLGLDELAETEGLDRMDMTMRPCQAALLEAVAAVNPNVVVVLAGGAPMETPWISHCKGLLYGSLGGQAGAGAMVDALTGKITPSGKLAQSWPLVGGDAPCARYFPGKERTAEYREGLFVGYRYYETAQVPVRFPFGFGLSYTSFSYSDITATDRSVSFTLSNTGPVAGAEVAQLYMGREDGAVFRPVRELKGFAKVYLEPGESRRVTIPLDDKAFRYFDVKTHHWEIEGGSYQIFVGASCRDIRLATQVDVVGTEAPDFCTVLPSYTSGRVTNVPDSEFETLLGRPIPAKEWDRSAPLGLNDTFAQLQYARGWVGRLVHRMMKGQVDRSMTSGKPDLDALFRYNMPFRGVAKMMGGRVDMAMAEALLEVLNGRFFRGLGHLTAAFFRKNKAEKTAAAALSKAGRDRTREEERP